MADAAHRGSTRREVERLSRPLLVRLHAQPRLLVPLATLVGVALGAFAPLPVAAPALAVVLAFLVWIGYLSWPVVPGPARLLRVLMVVLVAGLAVSRLA